MAEVKVTETLMDVGGATSGVLSNFIVSTKLQAYLQCTFEQRDFKATCYL